MMPNEPTTSGVTLQPYQRLFYAAAVNPNGHLWHMRFDRILCRNCLVTLKGFEDDDTPCTGAAKIRPIAGMRQQRRSRIGRPVRP
jgi:hypothetical protein